MAGSVARRGYKLGRREAAAAERRGRIINAARELLADEKGPPGFTVEAVAAAAGVARMTVYHQFQSKRGVLEALFDELANRGLVPHLGAVFHQPDPALALDALIDAFFAFWNSDRIVLRRARALASLDLEIAESVRARDERRREHLSRILARFPRGQALPPRELGALTDTLHVLTSFETFDGLQRGGRSFKTTVQIVRDLASAVVRPVR
jgi:AcrR family transcriptional regulator